MQIVRYNPFRELRRMERDLDKFWGGEFWPAFTEQAALDLYTEDGKLVAEATLPNFAKDEIKATTDEGALEISAEHKEKEEEKGKRRYYLHESSNQYFRRVALPEGVKADKAKAEFKDGVLKVTMPYAAPKEAKAIEVK